MGNYMPGPDVVRRDGTRPMTVQDEVSKYVAATMAHVEAAGLEPEHQLKMLESMKAIAAAMWPETVPPVIVESKVE